MRWGCGVPNRNGLPCALASPMWTIPQEAVRDVLRIYVLVTPVVGIA